LDEKDSANVLVGANVIFGTELDYLWNQTVYKENLIIHENYEKKMIENDIGLIKISGLTLIPNKIETIKLIPREHRNQLFMGCKVMVLMT
jgi:hypothetical protein